MTKLGPYEVHPAADAYPLIDGEEFTKLVDSIKGNGLREPIILNHDRTVLVDGRNRYRACEQAGVDPAFETLGSDYDELAILNLIVDRNERRRDLNPGQKAGVALELKPMFAKAIEADEAARRAQQRRAAPGTVNGGRFAKSDEPSGRDPAKSVSDSPSPSNSRKSAAAQAAKATGASADGVKRMNALKRDTPDLYDEVMAGRIALDAADKQRKRRVAAMPKPEPTPKPSPVMLTLNTHDGREVLYPKPQGKATFNETRGNGISWAAWSWNPVTGCLHGCEYCYAREGAESERLKAGYPVGFTPLRHTERLDAPTHTTIPARYRDDSHEPCSNGECEICAYRRVFVCSMADLYGRWVPDEWIDQVHASMLAAPQWQYITLTKFPARYVGLEMPPGAWVGTSVDEQKRVRIAEDAFRKIDGVAVKWLSLEPLREPLEFTDLSVFDWVVIGAQTQTRQPSGVVPAFAPPFEWVARLVLQAREAGCRIHLKPNLVDGLPGMQMPNEYPLAE
jgi:protein gp37